MSAPPPTLLVAALLAPSLSATVLRPPVVRHGPDGCALLTVHVRDQLELLLLEADEQQQSRLVDAALEAPSRSADEDPYGAVLWPAAQVVAHTATGRELNGRCVLELGAGTGLCSLAAAAYGARVIATDYRAEPLGLLQRSARLNEQQLGRHLQLETSLFDVLGEEPLPLVPDVLLAADLLYFKHTAEALAARCLEALRGGCDCVLIGDCGRPGQGAFLDALRVSPLRPEAVHFSTVEGWSAGSFRNSLISSYDGGGEARAVGVGVLALTPGDLLA